MESNAKIEPQHIESNESQDVERKSTAEVLLAPGANDNGIAREVTLLLQHFFNRTDVVGRAAALGSKPAPQGLGSAEQLASVVKGHVAGVHRIGSYTPAPDGSTRWLCFDCDGAGHSSPLEDPAGVAVRLHQRLAGLKVTSYIERSGGGHGYHVWVLLATPTPAKVVREFGLLMAEAIGAKLADGTPADVRGNRGFEVFPKSGKVADAGVGSMVYLPCWGAAANGGGRFYRVGARGELDAFEPDSFQLVSGEHLAQLVERYNVATAAKEKMSGAGHKVTPAPEQAVPQKPKREKGPAWEEWRRAALAKLPLESVYGEWLTGKAGNGYLECRDPFSPTGDRSPSAGVADGTDHLERGTLHSFRDGRNFSVFDVMIQTGKAKDFHSAAKMVGDLTGLAPPGQSRTFWKDFGDEALLEICAPVLDQQFALLRAGDGTERVFAVNARREVTLLLDEAPLHQAVYDLLKAKYGILPGEGVESRAITIWRRETEKLWQEPEPFAFAGDELTFKRFDSAPTEGPFAAWQEFLSRLSDPDAFMAFVWSCFEKQNRSRQYVWLRGDGQDGKSVVLGTLAEVFGPAAMALTNGHLKHAGQFLNSAIYGKRMVVYSDCKDPKFGMREFVRNWTSGDPVPVEFKHQTPFMAVLRVKLFVASNPQPDLTSQVADTSRMILIEVAPTETKDDPTWAARLKAELPAFLWACREVYQALCPKHGNIPIAETTKELLEDATVAFEETSHDIFDVYFEVAPGEKVAAKVVANILESKGMSNDQKGDFKAFLERKHGVKYARTGEGRWYVGMRAKPRLG